MSATVYPAPKTSSAPPLSQKPGAEASCPAGIFVLLAGGALWLVIATLLALLDSLKFHNTNLLAGQSWLTYGSVQAASSAAFLYGFGVPAALGLGLWFLCRLGRCALAGPVCVFVGAVFWHCAVAIGIGAILCGRSTGFASFEIPLWCARLMFAAYLMIGICALITFHKREVERLYPTQWFVVGALFWFPWIFSTAALVLLAAPERGVLQPVAAWWYAHNFDNVFLSFAGLAATFYFIPKIIGRPLYSHYQAVLAFWTIALFGSCGGIPFGAPVPSWITSLSLAGTILTALPIAAVAGNFYETARMDFGALDAEPALRFICVGLLFWIIAGAQQIAGALPNVSAITDFTLFGAAQKELFHYGFFALTVFGALYSILPGLLGLDGSAWSPKLLKLHFYFSFLGALISYAALLVAGLEQGILLAEGRNSFDDVMGRTLFPLRMSTLGDLLVAGGAVLFLLNFVGVLDKARRQCCARLKEAA
ncbi:MAG TPA: cbb3-type cytochrome c oxidase subunit I [Verrucomicrobiae bacterium]|jgi:cytochrome c oxidase cbb3-type subunit 1